MRRTFQTLAWLGRCAALPALVLCISASPATHATALNDSTHAVDAISSPTTDLEFARAAMDHGDFQVAMSHLSRQLDRSPGDGQALAFLANCVRTISVDDCAQGDHIEAEALLSQLSARVEAARQARFQPDAPVASLHDLVHRDRDIQQIGDLITASADEQAAPHIDAAMRLADEAHYHWYTLRANDRDKVREGLHELHWVHDRGPALSNDTMCRYWRAIDLLKQRVADSEWEPLKLEAGFMQKEIGQ